MRKQELVHLHALLARVRRDLDERDGISVPPAVFDAYDDHGVGPTAIAERKDAHRAAIDHLLEGIHSTLGAERTAVDAATAPSDSAENSHGR